MKWWLVDFLAPFQEGCLGSSGPILRRYGAAATTFSMGSEPQGRPESSPVQVSPSQPLWPSAHSHQGPHCSSFTASLPTPLPSVLVHSSPQAPRSLPSQGKCHFPWESFSDQLRQRPHSPLDCPSPAIFLTSLELSKILLKDTEQSMATHVSSGPCGPRPNLEGTSCPSLAQLLHLHHLPSGHAKGSGPYLGYSSFTYAAQLRCVSPQ